MDEFNFMVTVFYHYPVIATRCHPFASEGGFSCIRIHEYPRIPLRWRRGGIVRIRVRMRSDDGVVDNSILSSDKNYACRVVVVDGDDVGLSVDTVFDVVVGREVGLVENDCAGGGVGDFGDNHSVRNLARDSDDETRAGIVCARDFRGMHWVNVIQINCDASGEGRAGVELQRAVNFYNVFFHFIFHRRFTRPRILGRVNTLMPHSWIL